MLHTISWQEYITATLLLTALWYVFVILRYYRPEITNRFQTAELPLVNPSPLGAIRSDKDTVTGDEVQFGSSSSDDISDSTTVPGPEDELLAETQTLMQAFKDTADKTAFLSLLGVLLSKYEPYQDEIDLHIIRPLAAQLPFRIEEHEWPKF